MFSRIKTNNLRGSSYFQSLTTNSPVCDSGEGHQDQCRGRSKHRGRRIGAAGVLYHNKVVVEGRGLYICVFSIVTFR